MKIAFSTNGIFWLGGVNHLEYFIHAVGCTYEDIELSLIMRADMDNKFKELESLVDEVLFYPGKFKYSIPGLVNAVRKRVTLRNDLLQDFLKKHRIQALFGLTLQNSCGDIPVLSWIYDFRHVHVPEMFSRSEIHLRNKIFHRTAKVSERIILMSESAKHDFEVFVPKYANKARVLKTASLIPLAVYESSPSSVLTVYGLPEKFFYFPSQYWKHKNHESLFQAICLLKKKGFRIFAVCTGPQEDRYCKSHFARLTSLIKELDIEEEVVLLGMVPRMHMFHLIRQCVCVLNPSLFEGFGLTADEARSVGKRALLSDIPAHREQSPPKGMYFDIHSISDLAEKIASIWNEAPPGPDLVLERKAREDMPKRISESALSLIETVKEVLM